MSPNPHPHLRTILEDLYQHDPALRNTEAELLPLVEQLLALRPSASPSPSFRQLLRTQLSETHSRQLSPSHSSTLFQRMTSAFQFKYLAVPVSALAIVAIAVTTLSAFRNGTSPLSPQTPSFSLFTSGSVQPANTRQAFGSLASAFQGGQGGTGARPTANNPVSALSISADGMGKRIATSLIAPSEDLTNYKYVYNGELPTWNADLTVYKRTKGATQNSALVQALAKSTQGLVDLEKLNNLALQSFTLSQNTRYGYSVNVDLVESNVTISQNYREWPHPEAACKDEACFQRLRLAEGDVPADTELIRIANDFLRDYGISTERYGEPQVNSNWRVMYARTTDKSMFYIPDILTVVYPVSIDGNTTYDEGGFPHGLMVNISLREKRVESVSNLTTNNYESSSYTAETDQTRIRSIVEKGGLYGFAFPEAKKTVEVELQNPQIVLQKVWMPTQPGEPMNELLIPTLRFEVKDAPENSYLSNYVFVPLVKEVLDQRQGDVRIMM